MWRHVTPGDSVRFQVPLENAKRDAANAEQQRQSKDTNDRPDRRREQDVVRIHNLSGSVLQRGDIVGLGDPVIEPSESLDAWWHRPAFKGQLPLWEPQWQHPGRIAVMLEPCAIGAVASAVVSGCVHARVMIRDVNHEYADVDWTTGGVRLTSTDAGSACAQILAIEDSDAPAGECGGGYAERWAYVRLQNGGAFTLVGRAVERIGAFECGSMSPPRGRVQIYWLNPSTGTLAAVLDRDGNAIFVCPYNAECRPIIAEDWTRLHCDRWAVWWAVPQESFAAMLRAEVCIEPGSKTGTAVVMRQGANGYEVDTTYEDPVTVDNSDCLVFALPGELFPARREGCCTELWIPTAESGLTRRVRVSDCLPCDGKASVQVLQTVCGGETPEVLVSECTIEVLNIGGRVIAPCGPEEAMAYLRPKNKTTEDESDCCWLVVGGPFPTRAKGKLAGKLCVDTQTANLTDVDFPAYCGDWTKPTTARNPYKLAGCDGKAVELAPSFTGCECYWDIVQVEPQMVEQIISDLRSDCDTGCSVSKQVRKEVLLWSCDDSVCQSPESEPVLSGQTVTFLDNLTVQTSESGECEIYGDYTSICLFGCPESVSSQLKLITLSEVTAVVGVDLQCDPIGLAVSTQKFFAFCVGEEETESPDECEDACDGGIVLPGECISVDEGVDEDGCKTFTVNSQVSVVGGNGITVEKSGCAFAVSLNSGVAGPKSTLKLLCGVEITPIQITCVEGYDGTWSFSVSGGQLTEKFTEIRLPSAILETVSNECDGYSEPPDECDDCPECEVYQNLIYNPTTQECFCQGPWQPLPDGWVYCHEPKPVPQCEDHPGCEEGQTPIMQIGTGIFDCVADPSSIPEGWIQCGTETLDPPGSGYTFHSINCDEPTPHFAVTFNGFPTGAVSATIEVTGDQGSTSTVVMSDPGETIVGQEYWGALVDGWESPQPNENFVFVAKFRDAGGAVVATQVFTGSCA